jgi:hypothetical protein
VLNQGSRVGEPKPIHPQLLVRFHAEDEARSRFPPARQHEGTP